MTSVRIYFLFSLRGHQLKLNKKSVRLDIAKYSFSNRVVNEWNNLSEKVIARKSLAGLKKLIFIFVITWHIYKHFELLFRLSSYNKILYYGQFQTHVQV